MNMPSDEPPASVTQLPVDYRDPKDRLKPGESIMGNDRLGHDSDEEAPAPLLPPGLSQK